MDHRLTKNEATHFLLVCLDDAKNATGMTDADKRDLRKIEQLLQRIRMPSYETRPMTAAEAEAREVEAWKQGYMK